MASVRIVVHRILALPRRPSEVRAALLLMASLQERGWHRSVRERGSYAADGTPVPWWTYAATDWLDKILGPRHRVLEFGSGNSTMWLSERVGDLQSVEHDESWANKLRAVLPPNVVLTLSPTAANDSDGSADDPYLAPMRTAEGSFDLVVVDGMARNDCVAAAIPVLSPSGLLLLDDADRLSYRPAHATLVRNGFGRVDFYGPKPGLGYLSTTSIFSRHFDAWTRNLPPPDPSGY